MDICFSRQVQPCYDIIHTYRLIFFFFQSGLVSSLQISCGKMLGHTSCGPHRACPTCCLQILHTRVADIEFIQHASPPPLRRTPSSCLEFRMQLTSTLIFSPPSWRSSLLSFSRCTLIHFPDFLVSCIKSTHSSVKKKKKTGEGEVKERKGRTEKRTRERGRSRRINNNDNRELKERRTTTSTTWNKNKEEEQHQRIRREGSKSREQGTGVTAFLVNRRSSGLFVGQSSSQNILLCLYFRGRVLRTCSAYHPSLKFTKALSKSRLPRVRSCFLEANSEKMYGQKTKICM